MFNLWLPETVRDEWDPANDAANQLGIAAHVNRELKRLDARLDLIWVKPGAENFPDPGRWHVVRWNEGVPPTFWAWVTPDGGYLEPSLQIVEWMKAKDISRGGPTAYDQAVAARERRKAQAEQHRRAALDQFGEELRERADHLADARISVPREV